MDNLDITVFIEKIKQTYTVLQQLELVKEYFNIVSDKTNELINNVNNIQVFDFVEPITDTSTHTVNINKENLQPLLINVSFITARGYKIGELNISGNIKDVTYKLALYGTGESHPYLGDAGIGYNTNGELVISTNLSSYLNPFKCAITILYK